MAVPRSLQFIRLGSGGQALEVYLDLLCPFSAKQARGIDENVIPLISKGGKYDGKLQLIPRIYPQPFHYASTYLSEATFAFGQQYPDLWWAYVLKLFEKQKDYFNVPAQKLSIDQVKDSLVEVAISLVEEKGKLSGPKSKAYGDLRDALQVKEGKDGSINGGNDATFAFKHAVRIGRQNGIVVTPTVLFNGIKEDSVSSSFTKDDWEKFLSEKLAL